MTHGVVAELPRLIATDLDGTLLGEGGAVSARSAAVLRRAAAAGAAVVLVTGRSQRRLLTVFADLGAGYLAICANGAVVYDPTEARVRRCRPIGPGHVREVCLRLRQRVPQVVFAAHVDCGSTMLHEPGWPVRRLSPAVSLLAGAQELFDVPVVKLQARASGMDPDVFVKLVSETVGDVAEVTWQGYQGLVEMTRRGVTKASALAEMAAELRVAPAEVLAFGDMPNDVSMLRWAGRSVAVANAHTLARAAAKEVTLSNVEDGVALYIERLLSGPP
ncbi:HAD family hydrolase [Catellatospora sp. NPDC049111]|uniref:HAD family hydrolase n=1 Tax=Catellatospora sp. NPDC049111 TaxID=3155271 RepID=UPI0033CC5F16